MLRMIFVVLIIMAGTAASMFSAFNGLLFYLWNAYFRPESWVYGNYILQLRLSLVIGAYVVVRAVLSGPSLKICHGTVLIWLFLAQCVVGALTSEHPELSWSLLEVFFKVLLISYLIVVLVNDRKQFRLVLLVIALSLGFETAKQGWVNLIRVGGAKNNNSIPFLGDNNGVALGTMMLMPILGALAQTSGKRWERYSHRFVAIGVFLRGISTYSRGGFLGAGALGAIHIFRSEKKFRALMVVAALAAVVWFVMPAGYWGRMDTISVSEEERDASANDRLDFWKVAVDMAAEKPFTGVGLSAYTNSFPAYNTIDRYRDQQRAAHSVWFGVLGDLGYPGLLLFIGNIAVALWSCWRVTRLTRHRPEMRDLRVYANGLIGSLVVYAVVGSFLSAQYSEMAWHMIALATALFLVCRTELAAVAEPLPRAA